MKIEVTKEQYEAFKNGESITIEPPKEEYIIEYEKGCYTFSSIEIYDNMSGEFVNNKNGGLYRKTRKNAEHSRKKSKERNLLEALFEDIDGELWEWDHEGCNYTVSYNYDNDKWETRWYTTIYAPGQIYTGSKETAEKVCDILNSGLYSLD